MRLVIDASAAAFVAASARGFEGLRGHELHAPALMWSEVVAALHQQVWRGAMSAELGRGALEALFGAPIAASGGGAVLAADSWAIADRFGWAKTYDAEYVALARHLDAALLTRDARLRRGIEGYVRVADPFEL